jgi:hypothetical protein
MSTEIRLQIATLVKAGKLTRYEPRGRRPARRRLYLTEVAVKDLIGPSAVTILVGRGGVERALARWTLGDRVFGDETGRHAFLKRLCPPPAEIWEMRVMETRPYARLFGRFAEPDTLILTNFHTRGHLGDKGSRAWGEAMGFCKATWDGLFGMREPFVSTTIRDYVTENCDDYPICPSCSFS